MQMESKVIMVIFFGTIYYFEVFPEMTIRDLTEMVVDADNNSIYPSYQNDYLNYEIRTKAGELCLSDSLVSEWVNSEKFLYLDLKAGVGA